jgi:hypothetical protein
VQHNTCLKSPCSQHSTAMHTCNLLVRMPRASGARPSSRGMTLPGRAASRRQRPPTPRAGLGLPRRRLPPARPRALGQHSRLLAPEGRRGGAARALQLRRGRAAPVGRAQRVRLGVADGGRHLRKQSVGLASRPACGTARAETALQRPVSACRQHPGHAWLAERCALPDVAAASTCSASASRVPASVALRTPSVASSGPRRVSVPCHAPSRCQVSSDTK